MYSTAEQTIDFSRTDSECKSLIGEITRKISPVAEDVLVPACTDVRTGESFYLLHEGMALYQRDKQILLYLEEGDIVGLHQFADMMPAQVVFPLGVRVHEYNRRHFLKELSAHSELQEKWDAYISKQLTLYLSIITALHRDLSAVDPAFHHYAPGEVIMAEGSDPGLIFTLVQGRAEVHLGGRSVGEVAPSKIFGAYSTVTGTPWQASVVAVGPCLALSLNRSAFLSMLRFQSLEFLQIFPHNCTTIIV